MIAAGELTDELVCAAAAGDNRARGQLCAALLTRTRLMIMARLAPTPNQLCNVDDLSQDVMQAVIDGLPRLENKTVPGLMGYISQTVAHRVCDFIRQQPPPGRGTVPLPDSTVTGCSPNPLHTLLCASGRSPSSNLAASEEIARLLQALGQLKAAHQDVIHLIVFAGLSSSQAAEQLGKSPEATRELLKRALQALRRCLNQGCSAPDT